MEEDGLWLRLIFGYILIQFLLLFLLFMFGIIYG